MWEAYELSMPNVSDAFETRPRAMEMKTHENNNQK